MAENSAIEWTDHTHNFWVGCTEVSLACDHCYARSLMERFKRGHLWQGERERTTTANWAKPRRWNREAADKGIRFKVFTNSLADFFDNQVPEQWRWQAWNLIRSTPYLDWLILTKRPQNIAKMLPDDWRHGWPNVWLGTTVENQEEADRRVPHLLSVPAAVRFLSCEPLLGPVELKRIHRREVGSWSSHNFLTGVWQDNDGDSFHCGHAQKLDLVICGGESGPGARPMHPDWARTLRDRCAAASVPFFFKQWGEYHPEDQPDDVPGEDWGNIANYPDGTIALKVGKKRAGRLLDGREHNGMPGHS
jgi:protein gp37